VSGVVCTSYVIVVSVPCIVHACVVSSRQFLLLALHCVCSKTHTVECTLLLLVLVYYYDIEHPGWYSLAFCTCAKPCCALWCAASVVTSI
jgi:hypothetical protein